MRMPWGILFGSRKVGHHRLEPLVLAVLGFSRLAGFADAQVAEAVDDAHLALENKRGGIELGENGEALNARTSAQLLAGIDRGLFDPALQKHAALTPAR